MNTCIVHIAAGEITNKKVVANFFKQMKDGKHELADKLVGKRSSNLNRYYWGCVVKDIRARLIELGNDVTADDVHNFLKDRFNSKEIFSKDGTIIGSVGASTADLPNVDFMNYLEKIKQFAAEVLDIIILDPNQQASIFTASYDIDKNLNNN